MAHQALVSVKNLSKSFEARGGFGLGTRPKPLRAVADISFDIFPGETLAIVGESGCGKTTTLKMLLLLEAADSGTVSFKGENVFDFNSSERRSYRKSVQAVFQDPYSSLSPRMRVGDIIAEPLRTMSSSSRAEIREKVAELVARVGLRSDAAEHYPHEFSGGQRQRIAIARALSINPDFIVLDEPVSALDISIRAQIVNLLQDIQEAQNVSFLLVSHDLPIVRHMSHRTAVMYLGHLVEIAPTQSLYDAPHHPYTRALLSSSLPVHPRDRRSKRLNVAEPKAPTVDDTGCPYKASCPLSIPMCGESVPQLRMRDNGHFVACHVD